MSALYLSFSLILSSINKSYLPLVLSADSFATARLRQWRCAALYLLTVNSRDSSSFLSSFRPLSLLFLLFLDTNSVSLPNVDFSFIRDFETLGLIKCKMLPANNA